MKQTLTVMLFASVISGCHQANPPSLPSLQAQVKHSEMVADGIKQVKFVKESTVMPHTYDLLSGPMKKVVHTSSHPINDLESAYILARKFMKPPIQAASASPEWFFFGTAITAEEPPLFINGYAIARGGTEVIEWGTW